MEKGLQELSTIRLPALKYKAVCCERKFREPAGGGLLGP